MRTCPVVGAAEALTSTVVVALLRAFVIPEVSPGAVPVRLVATPLAGVQRSGAIRACPLGSTTVPVKVGELRLALSARSVSSARVPSLS